MPKARGQRRKAEKDFLWTYTETLPSANLSQKMESDSNTGGELREINQRHPKLSTTKD